MAQQAKVVKVGPGGRNNGPRPKVENPGKVFSTDEIFKNVWNETVYEANNTVMVHIRRLRTKIKDDNREDKIITTVWGVGYKIDQ